MFTTYQQLDYNTIDRLYSFAKHCKHLESYFQSTLQNSDYIYILSNDNTILAIILINFRFRPNNKLTPYIDLICSKPGSKSGKKALQDVTTFLSHIVNTNPQSYNKTVFLYPSPNLPQNKHKLINYYLNNNWNIAPANLLYFSLNTS